MKKHSKLRKVIASALFLAVSLVSTNALEVSRNELQSVNSDTIRFNNYNGPHSVIDSLAAIRNIGTQLGRSVKGNLENESTVGSSDRYYVIHAIDSTTGKLDADIFVLGKNVGVDHVRNLRHIIAAYLVEAYGYSNDDAFTLATFITVYNAVYRGNLDVFNAKYKDIVTKHLHKDKVGLSVNWEEWAGKSEIVIPLSDIAGGLSTIDTSVISDKNVINSMRESDDKGIDQRKNMVGIMDREADSAESKAEEAAKQAVQETRKLSEEQKKLAEEQAKSAEAQKQADSAQKEADSAQKAADASQSSADKAASDADKAAQSASDAQKEAQKARAEADKKQKEADEAWAKANELQKKADELAEYARQHPDDPEAQKAAEEAQKAADAARAEAEKKSEEAKKAAEEADKKEAEAKKAQEDAEKKAQDAEKQQQEADEKAKEAEQKQSEADKKAQDAEKQKEAEQAQKEKTAEQKQKADEAAAEAKEQQETADQKRSEAQNERNLIARDQQQLLNEGLLDEKDAAFGLRLTDSEKELSSVVKMNSKTGSLVKTSPVSVIRQRELIPVDGGFVAIAGEEGANHTIRLVLIDTIDMEIQKESEDIVAAKSVLVFNGGSFYVVVQDGANYVVAKYSSSLDLELKSKVPVDPATPITVGSNGVCVTAKDGTMQVLRLSDLTAVVGEVSIKSRRRK